jgi:hypothetical protein
MQNPLYALAHKHKPKHRAPLKPRVRHAARVDLIGIMGKYRNQAEKRERVAAFFDFFEGAHDVTLSALVSSQTLHDVRITLNDILSNSTDLEETAWTLEPNQGKNAIKALGGLTTIAAKLIAPLSKDYEFTLIQLDHDVTVHSALTSLIESIREWAYVFQDPEQREAAIAEFMREIGPMISLIDDITDAKKWVNIQGRLIHCRPSQRGFKVRLAAPKKSFM